MAAGAPVYIDDNPRLAYETSGADVSDHYEEPMARFLGRHLAPFEHALVDAEDPAVLTLATETRRLNMRDIRPKTLARPAQL